MKNLTLNVSSDPWTITAYDQGVFVFSVSAPSLEKTLKQCASHLHSFFSSANDVQAYIDKLNRVSPL